MDVHLCNLFNLSEAASATLTEKENPLIYVVLLIILISLNAFFAKSELAIVSLNDAKLEKMANEGDKKAKTLYNMVSKPTTFLSTIQIGVTLSGFLSSAVAADTFADYIVVLFENSGWNMSLVRTISIFVITLLLSFVTLVFGELLPKRIAMKDPEKVAFSVVGGVDFCYKIFKPLVWLVSTTVSSIAKLIGIKETDGQSECTEEEIRIMVDAGNEKGFIENDAKSMINNVFEFNDRTVGEIMTHRTEMTSIHIDATLQKAMDVFNESGYSRIPVYSDSIDDIEGILYMKDMMKVVFGKQEKEFNIRDYMREPLFVYENMKCDDLLTKFQKEKVQVAIVLDEYGGTFGIVSMEDLLESIVGNIQDEYDNEEEEIEVVNENHYVVDGATLIDEVAELIGQELDNSENDTIGGLLMDKLGYVPDEDEKPVIRIGNATFTISSMDDQSIDKIDVVVNKTEKKAVEEQKEKE